jgi:hypothetical protein
MRLKFLLTLVSTIFLFVLSAQNEKDIIEDLLDNWHKAAADADQQAYFDFIAEKGIYIGTDATENWTRDEFFEWSKSYFDQGKAWNFNAIERNIYLNENETVAWFDEQLEFPGGVLRGSGVLILEKHAWKLQHYVLSLPVPNEKFKNVLNVIHPKETSDPE